MRVSDESFVWDGCPWWIFTLLSINRQIRTHSTFSQYFLLDFLKNCWEIRQANQIERFYSNFGIGWNKIVISLAWSWSEGKNISKLFLITDSWSNLFYPSIETFKGSQIITRVDKTSKATSLPGWIVFNNTNHLTKNSYWRNWTNRDDEQSSSISKINFWL